MRFNNYWIIVPYQAENLHPIIRMDMGDNRSDDLAKIGFAYIGCIITDYIVDIVTYIPDIIIPDYVLDNRIDTPLIAAD